ncbi:MAG: hypothetical protein ACPHRO_03285 [Nannocystaceae bacterium]
MSTIIGGPAGCGGASKSNHRGSSEAATPPADGADVPAPASAEPAPIVARIAAPAAKETRFSIEINSPKTLEMGRDAVVSVSLTALEPWHVNMDYPTSLELGAPPQVELAQEVFEKRHARRLDEDGFVYEVGLTASGAGEKDFRGRLSFAVCEEDACVPVKEDIRFIIAVQ